MYRLIRPLLFRLEAETAHKAAFSVAGAAGRIAPPIVRRLLSYDHPSLRASVCGLTFRSPVGLAAGADKNARYLPFWEHAGMGFVEVGSVTARGGEGNPRPRSFRLVKDDALVNRMGLNNEGARRIALRLAAEERSREVVVGANVAKTHNPKILGEEAVADFVESFRHVAPHVDYVALNVSCPNTAEGKTFEEPEALDVLLAAIMRERTSSASGVPVFVKWSPPAPEEELPGRFVDLVACCREHGVDGHIATNTASDRAGLTTPKAELARIGAGGVSGLPLAERSHALVICLRKLLGDEVPIIGVGGINSGEEAYRRICAGASLVQIYTGLVFEGPGLIKRINRALVQCLERDGFDSIGQAVGRDAR